MLSLAKNYHDVNKKNIEPANKEKAQKQKGRKTQGYAIAKAHL